MYERDLPAHFPGDVFCTWPCSETLLYGKVSAIVKNLILLLSFSDMSAFSAIKFVQFYVFCSCCNKLLLLLSVKKGEGIERID